MEESILGKSHMNVNCVASVLVKQGILGNMKDFTLVRSLLNVNNVESVLVKQEH